MMSEEDGLPILSPLTRFLTPQPQPNSNSNPDYPYPNPPSNPTLKRKRNLPGTPDPDAEVVALSPESLMATNRFVCEVCNKGFQRDQNLQLHRRGHNLPWKLRTRVAGVEVRRKVYVCPESSCAHHEASRALGDLTGIKKHFSRKHGEKKWKCEKCCKKYAVKSDWKAHGKICGTREYRCDCGSLFSRKDSFVTHRAFCDARLTSPNTSFRNNLIINGPSISRDFSQAAAGIPQFRGGFSPEFLSLRNGQQHLPLWLDHHNNNLPNNSHLNPIGSSSLIAFPELVQTAMTPTDMFGLSSLPSSTQPPQWLNSFSVPGSSVAHGGILKAEEEYNYINFSESIMSCNNSPYYSSSDHHHHQNAMQSSSSSSPAHHHVSATELLHNSEQMGSTTSNSNNTNTIKNDSSALFNSCGLMSSSFMNPHNITSTKPNGDDDGGDDDNDNLNELLGDLNSSSSQLAMGSHTSIGGGDDEQSLSLLLLSESTKNDEAAEAVLERRGLTRDFLGVGENHVGGGGRGRAFFQEELAKFASVGTAMDRMSHQYSGN